MATDPDYIETLLRWRNWARELLGLHVVWKDHHLIYHRELPREAQNKLSAACLAAKAVDGSKACFQDCFKRRDYWQRNGAEPFVFTCHAGLEEYRVPVLLDGQLVGVWMLGPVRPRGRSRPAAIPAEAWAELPSGFPPHTATVARMLADHIAAVRSQRERYAMLRKARSARHAGIRQALVIIQRELDARLRAQDVAARVGLSPTRFSVAFKQATGRTFTDFVDEGLMDRAGQLLLDVDLPLRAIADRLGFSSASYFTRAFKRQRGMTPSAWRERAINHRRV